MKKLLLLALIVPIIVFIGCGKDDPAPLDNEIRFDGSTLGIENGYVLDFGLRGDYYYWEIIVTDGEYDDYSGSITEETTYAFVAHLYSETDDLSGEFVFEDGSAAKFFTASSKLIDDLTDGSGPAVESGTITIDGTSPTFTFEVNAVVDGSKLKGNFEGTFKIEPGSFNEIIENDGDTEYQHDLEFGAIVGWGTTSAGRTDLTVDTHYYTTIIISSDDFDVTTECPTNTEVWLNLYSLGTTGLTAGTYTNGNYSGNYIGYMNGHTDNGEYWNASEGTVVVNVEEGTNKYYITWDLSGYVYNNNEVRIEGVPTNTIDGEFKFAMETSSSAYCGDN